METFMFNLYGSEHNKAVKHPVTAQMNKKLRDFYFKNPQMRAFLASVEKRDEKFIISGFKGTEFESGEKVINRDTWDRGLLIVAEGELIEFDQDGENKIYKEGSILGVEQFLFNKKWERDLICK